MEIKKLIAQICSIGFYLVDSEKASSDFYKSQKLLKSLETFNQDSFILEDADVVVSVHIHYLDNLQELMVGLSKLPKTFRILITATSDRAITEANKLKLSNRGNVSTFLVPNRGRNFGPSLIYLRDEIRKSKYWLHLHSKASLHSKGKLGTAWLERNIKVLLDGNSLSAAVNAMNKDTSIVLAYADVGDLIRGINFRWGSNRQVAKRLLGGMNIQVPLKWHGKIDFPAGGMFLAKTEALSWLLEYDWKSTDFPEEKGQVDGTTQHAIERMLGEVVISEGGKHLVFTSTAGKFGFVSRDDLTNLGRQDP